MNYLKLKSRLSKRLGLLAITILLVFLGVFAEQQVLGVQASVQVLLVSRTAIPFGTVFPGEMRADTYNVQLDTSAQGATYVTTTGPISSLLNLCPFLTLTNIDAPTEPDTLPNSTLLRPGDTIDHWQVKFNVPGIKGQVAQDHDGGIVVSGGNYGCKITVITRVKPGKIIICKQSLGGSGKFNFSGDLGLFSIQTQSSDNTGNGHSTGQHNSGDDNKANCGQHNSGDDHNKSGEDHSKDTDNKDNHDGTGSKVFENLDPGNYSVAEILPQDVWQFSSLLCSDPSADTTTQHNVANIKLGGGETVSCTFINKTKPKGKISGHKFEAKDGHSKHDDDKHDDDAKYGLAGWTIYLDTNNNGQKDFGEPSTITDSKGYYEFSNLSSGTYHVRELQKNGWTRAYPSSAKYDINLTDGQIVSGKDFGNFRVSSISGDEFNDKNGNGHKDKDEDGLSGQTIWLKKPDGSIVTTTTDKNGHYAFPGLKPGVYEVSNEIKSGWKQTTQDFGKLTLNSGDESGGHNFGSKKK